MEWAGRAVTPPGITSVRDALAFGRAHDLSARRRDWITEYRRAFRFGLHYLPAGFGFDGLIVDVGANRGDFTATVRGLEPRSRVIAVEPGPGPLAVLSSRFANDPNVTIEGVAVSDRSGTAVLHEHDQSEFASLLTIRNDMPIQRDVEVRITTLDELVDGPVRLLKIDVQGHDVPVLAGASKTLAATSAVILEVVFTSQYEGDATFSVLDGIMSDAGFVLAGLGEPSRHGGRATWTDACYVRC
jgi:FkbM family methyltransferase